ncbi:MAG: CpsD/CapB family tyrosine-protein kinase, partial [Gemmataceae bacterium]|nr:CpsD/CapB family tyrosine-protein kinase [Gemmataceae bacterium]
SSNPQSAIRNPQSRDPVAWALQSLGQELQQLEASERLLALLFDREQQEARKLSGDEVQDELFRNDIARTQTLYDTIVKRLQDASLVKDFGGYDARLLASPGSSGAHKVQPSALVAGALALLLAVLFGCGLAYLAEATDTRLRSADELRGLLAAPVLGRLPRLRIADCGLRMDKQGSPDPLVVAYHQPDSAEAEGYRGLRTALHFRTRGSGPQVWQIASPARGDGKTTLAANLAVSLAQSGKRVVLIDANLRAPQLHRLLGVQADTGLAPVLAGEAELTDALQPTAIPGLTLLPCGPLPANAVELLTSGRFEEVLAALKGQSDYVLIDGPALLAGNDSCALAAQANGVLLALRGPRANRQQAEQARDLLASVNAHLLGVVLTEISRAARRPHQPSRNGHTNTPVTV